MYLSVQQLGAGFPDKGGGSADDVPSFYKRKKKNTPHACVRCRRQKHGCTGKNPCFYCVKARTPCEWIIAPEDTPPEPPTQVVGAAFTPAVQFPQNLAGHWQSSALLSGQPYVLPGNPYDFPVEPLPFVPGQGTPAVASQYLGAFPGASQSDFSAPVVNSLNYASVPSVAHTTGRSESTVVAGIPFFPNSPLAWSTPATSASHRQGQHPVMYDALDRPVDWGAHQQYYHDRLSASKPTRTTAEDIWSNTMNEANAYAVAPTPSEPVYTSARCSSAPPTYAAQFHGNVDGSMLGPSSSFQFADRTFDNTLPVGTAAFIDPAPYTANVSLPTLVPATSQSTGHVLDVPPLYGGTAFTDAAPSEGGLVLPTPALFARFDPRDAPVARAYQFPGDDLYNGGRGLLTLATPPSSFFGHRDLQENVPAGAIVFSDVDLYGTDGVPPLLPQLPSPEPTYHGHQEEFPAGGIVFSDADLYGINGEASLPLPLPSTQPACEGLDIVDPEATSTLTDAEFHAWLMAGPQVASDYIFEGDLL